MDVGDRSLEQRVLVWKMGFPFGREEAAARYIASIRAGVA
jgi:hypothetical protein